MYRMGTGDCFAIKFYSKSRHPFKVLIDAGAWSGSQQKLEPYIQDLKSYLEDYADVMIITHEHKDHVHAFDVCEELFTDGHFNVGEIWMAWTENEQARKVKEWKEKYGQKKKALAMAADTLKKALDSDEYKKQFDGNQHGLDQLAARNNFSEVLNGFADLHMPAAANGVYKGGLKGMEVAKNNIIKKEIKDFSPGDIITDLDGMDGMKMYVFGPPKLYEDIKKEAGGEGASYRHNKILEESGAFGAAVINAFEGGATSDEVMPFDDQYTLTTVHPITSQYNNADWRKIDVDWLYSAGSLALRMNSLTNNLSLALAFEFTDSGKVILFPGDAEYGSWASWHNIPWDEKGRDGKTPLTEDLLNRTVFYKVAHHLSHNGTAQKQGLEMMKSRDLAAMATLDYDTISSGWKSTMPNRELIGELLSRTKGRLMIMNEEGLYYDFHNKIPMSQKVTEARNRMSAAEKKKFTTAMQETDLYIQYTVEG
jgi:hypothetical protein